MSVFDEEYICDINEDESCPVCGRIGALMDVPQEEFPQYYNHEPIKTQTIQND
jgi:hypothetical protein